METVKTWREMASTIDARLNCIKSGNSLWQDRHESALNAMLGELPHGSGIDGEWSIDFEKSSGEKIVLHCQYHAMNENGMYDGWIDFAVTVTGSLQFGTRMKITGNFGKYQDIKDYLYDILAM